MKFGIIVNFVGFLFISTGFTASFANGKWIFEERKKTLDSLSSPDLAGDLAGSLVGGTWKEEDPDLSREQRRKGEPKNREASETTYVGAVLEYEPFNEWTDQDKGYGVLRTNAEAVVQFASRAKLEYGADILVIPEYGLTSLDVYSNDLDRFLTYTLYVPEAVADFVPCSVSDQNLNNLEALKILSCAALEYEMYLVINVAELYPCSEDTVANAPWPIEPSADCPEQGYFFYNTEVALDRSGTVVAKYRKEHLFMEDFFTPGPMDDKTALFLTDFNVLFSLQICFDIVFEHPGYNNVRYMTIRDVAMSTAWVDYLPFEIADVVQDGWSKGLRTNLLVAGHHRPEKGKMGSGVYRGYSGQLPAYIYNKDSGNVLVASNVTTIKATELMPKLLKAPTNSSPLGKYRSVKKPMPTETVPNGSSKEDRKHLMIHENLQNYTKILVKKGKEGETVNVTACSYDDFCCDFSYQYSGDQNYMLLVYSGKFGVGSDRYKLGKQVCAVVWCKTPEYKTCVHPELGFQDGDTFGPFSITSSNFKAETVFTAGIHNDLSLISDDKYSFQAKGAFATSSTKQTVSNLLVSALYGRWYCKDGY